ncbi:TRAP transporter substrate-binding protein DctP [Roseomonas sp. NAR14]|uniref:TRAP transporter substrate-binding protein DctP n=1 Tax=Roseomonas acroporae TaxID=2937791 RepID=A0A9X1Y9Y9_9PROT|nr:TRAP transporter substrate-binding protein DctP [Roseomonas acroporae]MCK8785800.1 TRAP transporter substrate-binding protein DctP [Roseomonas acroporae]
MQRRHLLVATGMAAAAGSLLPRRAARAQRPAVMRLSHQFPPTHHIARGLAAFAEAVKQRSGGTVEVQVFPAEQLARAGENFPGVARGAFEAACAVNFQWGNTLPEMSATTIPYYITDLARLRKFPGSEAAKFLEAQLEKRAVRNLAWLYTTRLSIFTSGRRPLVALEDFRGVKIRGLNPLTDHALSAVGAAPSAMPGPEVPQALQSGVLDAGLTDLSAAVSRRFYEIQKFGTIAPWFSVFSHVYVNPRWWNGLTAEQRGAIEAAARQAEQDQFAVTEETAASAAAELRAKGMTIHEQTPAESEAWKAAMQPPVIQAFLRQAPEGGRRILDLLGAL